MTNGKEFEVEVLRVARALWRKDVSGGPEFIDGRERDGVFYEEDVIHLIEATIEKSEEKARQDVRKLAKLAGEMRKKSPERVVKCWFITKHEPTDRQRAIARGANYPVHAVGFREFQGKLIDARDYVRARESHKFGSVHAPDDVADPKFVSISIKEGVGERLWSLHEVSRNLKEGGKFCLTADFGAGKSMVLRELFQLLQKSYMDGSTSRFPVHVNLREHNGAQYPDEILERHARIIGFEEPAKLVRAWKSGYVTLILDGFDEITSLGFQGRYSKLKEVRRRALMAVREMISSQPKEAGLIIAGREFYFDSYSELRSSLGVVSAYELTLNEFSDEQVAELLGNLGFPATQRFPSWLPKRPLFVATLALQGLLDDLRGRQEVSIGSGWNQLIGRICEREARISNSLDSATIRLVLERVATIARMREGDDFLSRADLERAFLEVCAYEPDEQGMLLLERLPGLAIASGGSESRRFVDQDFECALGAGDVWRYFVEPWNGAGDVEASVRPLTPVGVAVAEAVLREDVRSRSVQPAFDRAKGKSCLTFDLMQIARELKSNVTSSISMRDLHVSYFDSHGHWPSGCEIYLSDCILDSLEVETSSDFSAAIRLQGCLISSLSGVRARSDLPKNFADDRTTVESVSEEVDSNASILTGTMPLPVRVLLVVLRKLYVQKGAARRENALFRGLDVNAQRYVEDVLAIVGSEGLATREKRGGEPLVVPNRAEMARVLQMLSTPETSQDPVLVRVKALA